MGRQEEGNCNTGSVRYWLEREWVVERSIEEKRQDIFRRRTDNGKLFNLHHACAFAVGCEAVGRLDVGLASKLSQTTTYFQFRWRAVSSRLHWTRLPAAPSRILVVSQELKYTSIIFIHVVPPIPRSSYDIRSEYEVCAHCFRPQQMCTKKAALRSAALFLKIMHSSRPLLEQDFGLLCGQVSYFKGSVVIITVGFELMMMVMTIVLLEWWITFSTDVSSFLTFCAL